MFRDRLVFWTATILMAGTATMLRADVGNKGAWGDQGDGTYKNPVLPGDYSDPDVIRVGADYYLITSTFQYSPGMAVMHSKDLVNWEYASHVVDDVSRLGPELNWNRMNRYNRGIYAGSLRYHEGRFWCFFTTMDEGFFMATAKNAAGPWEPVQQVWDAKGYDDPCPFWDEDGKAYLVYSKPGKEWYTHLCEMSADGKTLNLATDKVIDNYQSSEGNKLYKINGWYYVFHNESRGGGNRVGVFMRSKNIWGPYEKKLVLHGNTRDHEREPNQGGLLQTEKGDWWFITQQGRGAWEGRSSLLLPVQWIDGWPIPGTVDKDGVGTITWSFKKPVDGFPITTPQGDDEFDKAELSPQWEWNYAPRKEMWSLAERPGFLRLHAFKPLKTDDLMKAGNTLSRRVESTEGGEVVMKMEIGGMADGQFAGLCHFSKTIASIGVVQEGAVRRVKFVNDGKVTVGPEIKGGAIFLKSVMDAANNSTFMYSTDGKAFEAIGDAYHFEWKNYRGGRIDIFNYNNEAEAGYVDVDYFHYSYVGPGGKRGG